MRSEGGEKKSCRKLAFAFWKMSPPSSSSFRTPHLGELRGSPSNALAQGVVVRGPSRGASVPRKPRGPPLQPAPGGRGWQPWSNGTCCCAQSQPGCAGGLCQGGEGLREPPDSPGLPLTCLLYRTRPREGWSAFLCPEACAENHNDKCKAGCMRQCPPLSMNSSPCLTTHTGWDH